MIIAIDFDSTLCDPTNIQAGYRMGRPTTGAIMATHRLAEEGHTIIVFTAREVNRPEVKKAVQDWCDYFKIPIHGITNVKQPYFDLMIDNRGIHFGGNWSEVLSQIKEFEMGIKNHPNKEVPLFTDITRPLNEQ